VWNANTAPRPSAVAQRHGPAQSPIPASREGCRYTGPEFQFGVSDAPRDAIPQGSNDSAHLNSGARDTQIRLIKRIAKRNAIDELAFMAFTQCYFHCVFSTRDRQRVLAKSVRDNLWPYMGGIARNHGIRPLAIGGLADHAHLLISLPATMPVCKAMQYIKGGSSRWIHDTFPEMHAFAWQKQYGAFTVGHSQRAAVIEYIRNQEAHHHRLTFKEEFREFLDAHGIEYDERYMWD
jgi:REP element-mobilizing transposase RayT